MEENQQEIKEVSSIQDDPNKNQAQKITQDDSSTILKEIFKYKQTEDKIKFIPILQNSKNVGQKLISIFSKPDIEIKNDNNSYTKFLSNRINLLNKIKEIIASNYEIMHIIINFLEKNEIYLIIDIIDYYIDVISYVTFEKEDDRNKYISDMQDILNWFISSGLLNKNHTDYIFQALAKSQLYKKLTPKLFSNYLSLIELIYGKNYKDPSKQSLIAKNYIYFYDKENSMIKTNISKSNEIYIKDSCTIFLWFYLNQEENMSESNLCKILLIKGQETNHNEIDFILNKDKDIDIKLNSLLLKEIDEKKFEIKNNVWTHLKIQILKNIIKLNVYQNFEGNKNKENMDEKEKNEIKEMTRYETKVYRLNDKNSSNNNDINLELSDSKIIDLSFFTNFLGYVGTIIFCNNDNPNEVSIKSLYGLKSNNISKFLEETTISDIFFIISPTLYIKERNKFVYMNNNITGELQYNSLDSVEEEDIKKIIDYNNVFKYSNYVNNIYHIGGSVNILPLFEIFYKFSKKGNNNEIENKTLENIFLQLFQLMEVIIVNKPKNYLDIFYNNNIAFFKSIQLFLENINEKFYKNDDIITILTNIGKYIFSYCKDNETGFNEIKNKNMFDYFKEILFYPKIVLKFSLEQQNKIWQFFEEIKIIQRKELKTGNFSEINLSFCKKCFLSFFQLNNFILLFNKKYPNEYLSPDLINIIKYIFLASETSDIERESLLLLINNENKETFKNRISDKIIISILEIFIFYFDTTKPTGVNAFKANENIKTDKKEKIDMPQKTPKKSLEYFLNSENHFIENLLRIVSSNNLKLKKVVINLIKTISLKYIETLKNYFSKVEADNKKSRKTKKNTKVTGKEFYYFIQENISPNENNESIREKQKLKEIFNQNKIEEDKERRKSSMDSLNLINKSKDDKNKQIENNNLNLSNQNKSNDNLKMKSPRSKTPEERKIDEFKNQFFQRTKENINIPRKTVFNFTDNRISSPYGTNSQENMIRILTMKNPVSVFDEKDEDVGEDKKDKNEDLIETQNISMNLFEWLLNCETSKNYMSIKKSSSNLSSSSNAIFDKNNAFDFNFSEIIINYLLKLFESKNLEVIYKILFLVNSQSGTEMSKNKNTLSLSISYKRLLGYFSSSKTQFIKFLEELTINTYLCTYYEEVQNKFNYIKESSTYTGLDKKNNEYFSEIYNVSKEIIIDIYFYENKMKNDIIDEIFNIVLSLYEGLKKVDEINDEDIKIKNILFTFLQEFLTTIIDLYNSRLDYYKKNLKNNNDKSDPNYIIYKEIEKKYACFLNFVFEYLFLLTNSNNYISKSFPSDEAKIKNFVSLPDFLVYEFDKDGNKKIMEIKIDLYLKIYKKILDYFNIEKLLEKINNLSLDKKGSTDLAEKKDKNKNEKYKRIIFYFEPREITKLLKEYTNNKEIKTKFKERLTYLFLSYSEEFKDLPLILMISILNNYYISTKTQEKIDTSSDEGFNFTSFLNSHMKYILTIILIAFFMKENDNYNLNKSYKEIQEIIFNILLYNVNNIINCFNSSFGDFCVEIFANILTLMSCLWVEDKEHKSLFSLNKNKQKNAIKRILNYYSTKNKNFFDAPTFEKIASQNVTKNREMILQEKNNIYDSIIKNTTEDKPENIPTSDIFNFKNYQNIYISRQYALNNHIKLLINDDSDKLGNNIDNEEEKEFYENILYKVDKLKVGYDNNEVYLYCFDRIKKKNYRKIKKRLYSWNNSYSNLEVFYNQKEKEGKDDRYLKYKISNYLSGDMTRKYIVPILDIDFYMPKFQIFNYKDDLFRNRENNQLNDYERLYKIDVRIFEEKKEKPKEKSKFSIFNACYIKATHHIRGKLFFEKQLSKNDIKSSVSILEPSSSFYFMESNITNDTNLLKNYEDYDSDSKSCFISIFRNNQNPKDPEIFLDIDFSNIIFIFIRKYCFRNNSLEIFLSNHRSYYFKFFDNKERDEFLSELILLLNKNNPKNKIFKPIKSIDENNKTIILGYVKEEDKYKEYNSISNIRDLWKSNKISTLEYLMWINIYGNRSFRDSSQYPVFPWLLLNHEFNTFDDSLKNFEYRNFNYPMGLLSIDEKGKKRQEAYIDTYKLMVMNLIEENLLNIKIKEEEETSEQTTPISNTNDKNINPQRKSISSSANSNKPNINETSGSVTNTTRTISTTVNNNTNNQNLIPLSEQIQDKYLPKLPEYKFDIEKLYGNLNLEYEKIPYFYGSHFSNSMYISHYLMRIFPYCLTMIEIQKKGFDVPERLFINLHKSFYTAISDKGDLREIIPEFFTLPEMFLNINNLNLGEINIKNYQRLNFTENEEESEEKGEIVKLNEVIMPTWCEKSPFIFSEKYRKLLESQNLNINPWIDLLFGYTQRGSKAQKVGNLYLPYSYDGVINARLSKEKLLNNRVDFEYQMRYFEMGVHPTKVFEKKNRAIKNKPNNQFIDIVEIKQTIIPEIRLKKLNENNPIIGPNKKIIYFDSYLDEDDEFFILDNNYTGQKINIQESKEPEKYYYVKESVIYKEFPIKDNVSKNAQNKLIIKSIFKNKYFILGGYFDGSLYLVKMPNKLSKKEEGQKGAEKYCLINEEKIVKQFDKSLITALEIDKNEKYLIYGTNIGSIVIYYLHYNLFKENKNFIEYKKIFKSHNGYPISSISINPDLNLFADCSIDGYVNMYTLSPYDDFKIINSIHISKPFIPNFVFLSAQPLASVVLYSNDLCQFKCFSINGSELNTNESDTNLMSNKFKEYYVENDQNMNSPIIFTDSMFNDYLIYIFKKKYVVIREFPSMKMKIPFNPTLDKYNEELCSLCISDDKKYLYALEQKSNKIYMINQKFFSSNKLNKSIPV